MPACLYSIDQLLGVLILGIGALERHRDLGRLQLRRELAPHPLHQGDVLLVGHQRAGGGVEVGAPVRRRVHVGGQRSRVRVGRVHLAVQRLELVEGQVAGAALGRCLAAGGRVGRLETLRALRREVRPGQDVGRRMQVTLAVPADQLAILREGHVALDDPGAHPISGEQPLPGMLREHQRRPPV